MAVKWCVVCSSHYEDSKITELEGALNSVKKLQSVIVSELGVSEEDTLFIYDKNQYEITTEIMKFENDIQKDDVVVFYFCGHGIKVGDELWLFTNNTIKKNIEMTALNYNILRLPIPEMGFAP